MGTRASFFIGNPEDVRARKWLGCIAFDGHPDGDCEVLSTATTPETFIDAVQSISAARSLSKYGSDFCNPVEHGFPFPWDDDLFLTDYTYAFFDGKSQLTCSHHGWISFSEYANADMADAYHEGDSLPRNVPAPKQYDRSGPDSIMIISVAR